MQIFVRDIKSGRTMTVDVEDSTKIQKVKYLLNQKFVEYFEEGIILFWGGEQVDNSVTLEEAGIRNEDTLALAMRPIPKKINTNDNAEDNEGCHFMETCRLL